MRIRLLNTACNEDAPPMNLLYLATALRHSGFKDTAIIDNTFGGVDVFRQAKTADLVGISAMTRHYRAACAIAGRLKSATGMPVIVGGSHISTLPDSLTQDFSFGVIGEGEYTLVELCRNLGESKDTPNTCAGIAGIVYREKGAVVHTPARDYEKNIDAIPLPDFALLDRRYFGKKWILWNNRFGRAMKIITARGCPYRCIFCASQKIWGGARLHSAERICREIETLVVGWGIDHIYIDDDLFIVNKERLGRVAYLLEKSGLGGRVTFFCTARTNLIDDEMCRLLRRIGVRVLTFGFESGSDRVLRYLKGENITVAQHLEAIRLCTAYGFKVWGSVMLGNPTETVEDMGKTIAFMDAAIKNGCHRIGVFVATPLPGTAFWEIARQRGKVSESMDFDTVDYANVEAPALLESTVDAAAFRAIFRQAIRRHDRLLAKDVHCVAMALRLGKCVHAFLRDPRRAITILKNMFLQSCG